MTFESDDTHPPTEPTADAPAAAPTGRVRTDAAGLDFFSFHTVPTSSITEEYFATLGPMSREQGWCVIPQERKGKRMPGKVDGVVLKPSKYHEVPPSQEEVEYWARQHFSTNVAVVLGRASGGVWCLDIDTTDLELALKVQYCAFRILGETPFRRIGNRPKQALFYRAAEPEDMPPSRSFSFVDEKGQSSEQLIEILGARKMITVYGRHHQTLKNFVWPDFGQPAISPTSDVPAITIPMIEAFLAEVQKIRAFHWQKGATGPITLRGNDASECWYEDGDVTPSEDVSVPKISTKDYSLRDGLVCDKREDFLRHVAWTISVANVGALLTDEGRAGIRFGVTQAFRKLAVLDGRWTSGYLAREVAAKVGALVAKAARGEMNPKRRGTRTLEVTASALAIDPDRAAASASWITLGQNPARLSAWMEELRPRGDALDKISFTGSAKATIPDELRIAVSAAEQSERAGRLLAEEVDSFLDVVDAHSEGVLPKTRVVKAPTGAGKTVNIVGRMAARKVDGVPMRIGMLAPQHKNLHEIREKAEAAGLAVAHLKGVLHSDCHYMEQQKLLHDSGRSGSSLCRSKDEEGVERFCPFYEAGCSHQQDRRDAVDADLILMPHAYLTVQAPAVLKQLRGVVVDESVSAQVCKALDLEGRILTDVGRSLAYLTKAETKEKLDPQDFMEARDRTAELVLNELRAGRDPARAFVTNPWTLRKHYLGKGVSRSDVEVIVAERKAENEACRLDLDRAIAVCSRTDDELKLRPGYPVNLVAEICAKPEQEGAAQEAKLYRIIKDRILDFDQDLLNVATPVALGEDPAVANKKRKAKGKRDRRLEWYPGPTDAHPGTIAIRWRSELNFGGVPMLALDASANETIAAKVFKQRMAEGEALDFREIIVPVRMNTTLILGKSFSKTTLLPRPDDSVFDVARRAQDLHEARLEISVHAAMNPGRGVVLCMPKAVKGLVLDSWTPPSNVSFMHFSATRGLDFAKNYSSAVALGCINPNGRQIDDLVAALLYDEDDEIQNANPAVEPGGEFGGEKSRWTYRSVDVRMRNGATMIMQQRHCDGLFASLVYDQIRREEHLQYAGRLRPIHRDEVPSFVSVGDYLPENLIVDDVLLHKDVVAFGAAIEGCRREQTYVGENVSGILPSELASADRLLAIIERSENIRLKFAAVRLDGAIRYVPAFLPQVVDRLIDEGGELVYAPTQHEIVRPAGWVEDVEVHGRRDAEADIWDQAYRLGNTLAKWREVDAPDCFRFQDPDQAMKLKAHPFVAVMRRILPPLIEAERLRKEQEEADRKAEEAEREAWILEIETEHAEVFRLEALGLAVPPREPPDVDEAAEWPWETYRMAA